MIMANGSILSSTGGENGSNGPTLFPRSGFSQRNRWRHHRCVTSLTTFSPNNLYPFHALIHSGGGIFVACCNEAKILDAKPSRRQRAYSRIFPGSVNNFSKWTHISRLKGQQFCFPVCSVYRPVDGASVIVDRDAGRRWRL